MKLTIRKGMFETNSSSMHSIIITDNTHDLMYLESIKKYMWDDGTIPFYDSELEFGRSPFDVLADPYKKTAYAIASFCGYYKPEKEEYQECREFVNDLTRIFREVINGFDHLVFNTNDCYPFGYVDHQSNQLLEEFLEDEHVSLEDFIFSPQYVVIIDGDESCVWDSVKRLFKSNIVKEVY